MPQLQPDPTDLTNALLLRILQNDTSFGGADPLTPVMVIHASIVTTQCILFVSLAVTLFVAFVAVLGKQWILYYTRGTTWGNIADRGKERQVKLTGLQKWGLHFIMESLPVMLQFALLLFGVALAVFLWELNVSVAEVALVATPIGVVFYIFITVVATIYSDCPFQTPLSTMLPKVQPWTKEFKVLARVWLRRRITRAWAVFESLRLRMKNATEGSFLWNSAGRVFNSCTGGTNITDHAGEDAHNNGQPYIDGTNTIDHAGEDTHNNDQSKTLSDPAFWRDSPIFASPIPKDVGAYAGFWLLENSTDFSAASSVAAVFSEFQLPSHHRSTTALIRLRDTYMECFRAPEFKNHNRLKALQSAAAYYVLYHAQLTWTASSPLELGVTNLPPDLPPDLFLHAHSEEWHGDDVFKYLLHLKDRSEPGTSARFLSYIAPYWFCGDSDSNIRSRPSRLRILFELTKVLEESGTLDDVTVTDCILCVGAAMDFPLHPEDLIRVDKRCVLFPFALTVVLIGGSYCIVLTFKMVVEHIHTMVLNRGNQLHDASTALKILIYLVEKIQFRAFGASWATKLLQRAALANMDDETFTLFLRLLTRGREEGASTEVETQPTHPELALFAKISQDVRAYSNKADVFEDEAVYDGLIAMKDIPQLGSYHPDDDFLEALSEAMKNGKPFRVRQAAYDVILAAQEWLTSAELRGTLMRLGFPRQLHSVVLETGLSDQQRPFLGMMEILSEDRFWRPYLRGAMEIWFPFRRKGPKQVLQILARVGELPLPAYDDSNPPALDKFIEKLVEDEWAGVPGRPVMNLTADFLEPLAEVTKQLEELLFTEDGRKAILAVVWHVIPSLEKRRDGDYKGPENVRHIVDDLLEKLREQEQSFIR